jgi:anaerobic selenocysteine-containing dehydrogenase
MAGEHVDISSEQAMDEVAARLTTVIERHGPASVAGYFGTYAGVTTNLSQPFIAAFMKALGSPLLFSPETIDKPGKSIARAMHGTWMAPLQLFDQPDVALLVGANPLQSYYGIACGHPTRWLNDRFADGLQLIVVDPRRTEIASRASVHLQPKPGHDVAILAALIHVILEEEIYDADFVAANAQGLDALRYAVAAATPASVAEQADLAADDIVRAARIFAGGRRGYACAGVGPGFAASSTLVEYLILNLETLCGHWLRAGERVPRPPSLLPVRPARAQAAPPRPWTVGDLTMPATGARNTSAGIPVGALADEILSDEPGRVRVLLSCGGSPVGAWPDQLKSIEAMNRLELLVQLDPWMSGTAQLAHYVIAPTMPYEVPAATLVVDLFQLGDYFYAPAEPHAQYTPAVVGRPEGSDVIEEWEFFYGLAQRMGLQLILDGYVNAANAPVIVDMLNKPTSDELIEALASGGRVSLAEVKRHPAGLTITDPPVLVAPKEPGWAGRLELAHPTMLADLAVALDSPRPAGGHPDVDDDFPFRLLCRRIQQTYNHSGRSAAINKRPYNPAFMHPGDMAQLGLADGDAVFIRSARASIPALVRSDPTLRPGVVSMAHGFGAGPERDSEFRTIGSPTSRLVDGSDIADQYAFMPRLSNIPVRVVPWR